MPHRSRSALLAAVIAVPVLLLSACSAPQGGGGDADVEATTGGTLKLAGNSDVLYLDPAAAYSAPTTRSTAR